MWCLMILVATTTAVVSGLRAATPGFAVDYRSFGTTPVYQDLPYREQSRAFREAPPAGHQHQSLRQDFRDYRPQTYGEEARNFHDGFKDEIRHFNEARPFREEARHFKDENRFRDDMRTAFRDERMFREEIRPMREGPRHFRDERNFNDEMRHFRDDLRQFRDEARPFREEIRFEAPRNFRDDFRPFRTDLGSFRDESPTGSYERPFGQESATLRNEPRPFADENRGFKDELLFGEESHNLAEAQHRFNKEHRQPLSFGGHSNYLKFGNHGLGFASVPAAILPLEDHPHRMPSGMMLSDMSTTPSTQSPNYEKSSAMQVTLPSKSFDANNHMPVTLPPEAMGSTPGVTRNSIDSRAVSQRTNENLVDSRSTSPASTAVTISTSPGTNNATPKDLFAPGPVAMSGSSMGMSRVVEENGPQQQTHQTNSLHASKPEMHMVSTQSSYFPAQTSREVPEALLNYIFKYQLPDETKQRVTYRNALPSEILNHIQSLPLIQSQSPKFTILPELKISGLSTIRQPGGAINYVPAAGLTADVSYLGQGSSALALGAANGVPTVNFASNLIPLDRDSHFSQLGQSNQYSQLRSLGQANELTQVATQFADLGQNQQIRNNPFNQEGLQLQLGNFGGIDYSGLSSSSDGTRGASGVSLGLSEPVRAAGATFAKPLQLSFGESIWQL